MGSAILAWAIYLAWVIWRNVSDDATPMPTAARRGTALSATAALVIAESVLYIFVAAPMWRGRVTAPPITPRTIVVRVVAQQYQWAFHYPGADGAFGEARADRVTLENPAGLDRTSDHAADDIVSAELHVPVGRPVVAQITSKDVIHSFGVTALQIKQDAVPGTVATIWFTPKMLGRFDITCSQLCGPQHDRMRGVVVVDSDADYARFLAAGGAR